MRQAYNIYGGFLGNGVTGIGDIQIMVNGVLVSLEYVSESEFKEMMGISKEDYLEIINDKIIGV